MTYECRLCGLEVDEIPEWKKSECPEDEYQHRFEERLR